MEFPNYFMQLALKTKKEALQPSWASESFASKCKINGELRYVKMLVFYFWPSAERENSFSYFKVASINMCL